MVLVKKLFVSISGMLAYLSFPLLAFATSPTPVSFDPCDKEAAGIAKVLCSLGDNVGNTLQSIVVFFVIIAILFALIYLLWGGVSWITSRGEKTAVESARNHIIAAILGLIVVFLTLFILTLVLAAFGLDFSDIQIPTIGTGK